MKYADLTLSQQFSTGNGEYWFIKTRDGGTALETGITVSFHPDDDVTPEGEAPVLHTTPTEIERCALTLLVTATNIQHPGLLAWVHQMAQDPNEMRTLDDFVFETATVATKCREFGFITPTKHYDRDNWMAGAILERKPRGAMLHGAKRMMAEYDRINLILAMAVCDYRYAGRPSGDQTHQVRGMDSVLLNVSTSLAAEVANYHRNTINTIYNEMRMA